MNKSVLKILDNPESLKTYYINSFFFNTPSILKLPLEANDIFVSCQKLSAMTQCTRLQIYFCQVSIRKVSFPCLI